MTIFQSYNWTEVLIWAVQNKMTAWHHFVIFSVTLIPFLCTWNGKGYGVFLSHLFYCGSAFQTNLVMQQRSIALVLTHTSRVAMQLGRRAAWCNRSNRFKEKSGEKEGKRVKRGKERGEKNLREKRRKKKTKKKPPKVACNQWPMDGRTDGLTVKMARRVACTRLKRKQIEK